MRTGALRLIWSNPTDLGWPLSMAPKAKVCHPSGVKAVSYDKIGTIQRRLAWPLRKDDTQIREAFQIFCVCKLGRAFFTFLPLIWSSFSNSVQSQSSFSSEEFTNLHFPAEESPRNEVKRASTAIPRWKYAIPSDLASQATLGPLSTWIGDGLGIVGAVDLLPILAILLFNCFDV